MVTWNSFFFIYIYKKDSFWRIQSHICNTILFTLLSPYNVNWISPENLILSLLILYFNISGHLTPPVVLICYECSVYHRLKHGSAQEELVEKLPALVTDFILKLNFKALGRTPFQRYNGILLSTSEYLIIQMRQTPLRAMSSWSGITWVKVEGH